MISNCPFEFHRADRHIVRPLLNNIENPKRETPLMIYLLNFKHRLFDGCRLLDSAGRWSGCIRPRGRHPTGVDAFEAFDGVDHVADMVALLELLQLLAAPR